MCELELVVSLRSPNVERTACLQMVTGDGKRANEELHKVLVAHLVVLNRLVNTSQLVFAYLLHVLVQMFHFVG